MVAIKDIEMPSCCAECYTQDLLRVVDCTLFNDCHCLIERHHDCPLVEIEERKVGKLEKIEQIVKEWESSKIVTNCYECADQIKCVLEQE